MSLYKAHIQDLSANGISCSSATPVQSGENDCPKSYILVHAYKELRTLLGKSGIVGGKNSYREVGGHDVVHMQVISHDFSS